MDGAPFMAMIHLSSTSQINCADRSAALAKNPWRRWPAHTFSLDREFIQVHRIGNVDSNNKFDIDRGLSFLDRHSGLWPGAAKPVISPPASMPTRSIAPIEKRHGMADLHIRHSMVTCKPRRANLKLRPTYSSWRDCNANLVLR